MTERLQNLMNRGVTTKTLLLMLVAFFGLSQLATPIAQTLIHVTRGKSRVESTASDSLVVFGGARFGETVQLIGTDGKLAALSSTTLADLSGANLTTLNASNVSSGTLASDRLPVVPIAKGGTGGTAVPTANGMAYGTGAAYAFTAAGTSGHILTSNGAATPPTFQTVPNLQGLWAGSVVLSTVACPTGWSRDITLDNQFVRGGATSGATGGSDTHLHGDGTLAVASHDHQAGQWTTSGPSAGLGASTNTVEVVAGTGVFVATGTHLHNNAHDHTLGPFQTGLAAPDVTGSTASGSTLPAFTTRIYCVKD